MSVLARVAPRLFHVPVASLAAVVGWMRLFRPVAEFGSPATATSTTASPPSGLPATFGLVALVGFGCLLASRLLEGGL